MIKLPVDATIPELGQTLGGRAVTCRCIDQQEYCLQNFDHTLPSGQGISSENQVQLQQQPR